VLCDGQIALNQSAASMPL